MNATSPRVSVVMAVYNGEAFLREAIDSILSQTFTDFEIIVVDDGSTDRKAQILSKYSDPGLSLLDQPNRGLAYSLNRGIQNCSGIYIGRMDADDISEPDGLKQQVEFIDSQPDYVLAGTNAMMMTEDRGLLCPMNEPLRDDDLRKILDNDCESPFVHGSVMFRILGWTKHLTEWTSK